MIVKNEAELTNAFNLVMIDVIDAVAEQLTKELMEIIETEVYEYYVPKFYERTGEFRNSWEHSQPALIGNIVESQIFQNYASMHFNKDKWQHGSKYYGEALDEHGLAEIINDGKIGLMANFPQLGERPFWDEFQKYVDEHIDEIFIKECKLRNVPIQGGINYSFK